MSVKLHYGPPGSYKTSGTIFDDLPVAVQEGRVLITNIRGLDDAELVKKVIRNKENTLKNRFLKLLNKYEDKVSDKFEIIYLDTKREEQREKLRRFYHWAPQDAYLILDEINTIWPKDWRPAKLKEFDLHRGSIEDLKNTKNLLHDRNNKLCLDIKTGEPIPRAQNLTEALEMHRHFNYDFAATSPSYKKFNSVFHEVAEVAFGHTNRAVIGLKGSYWETMHEATNAGIAKSDKLSVDVKKIPKWVFKCYQSTATGEIRDSTAGSNIFLKPKVILPVVFAIGLIYYGLNEIRKVGLITSSEEITNANTGTTKTNKNSIQQQNSKNNISSNSNDIYIEDSGKTTNPVPTARNPSDFLQDFKIYISGILWNKKLFSIEKQFESNTVDLDSLNQLGYEVTFINKCTAKIVYKDSNTPRLIMCRPNSNRGSLGQRVNFNPFSDEGSE